MKIVCSSSMPFAREAFSSLGDVALLDGRSITNADVRDADALAIRSTTRVDSSLLQGSRVRFVGTATIGTDHLDTALLDAEGIRWCAAPGCNANSVSEYVIAALLHLAATDSSPLDARTIAVIGVGNVGSLVVEKARALGMRPLLNDPPRERTKTPVDAETVFASLDDVLPEADIVTLHVPLSFEGPDKTFRMADTRFFDRLKPGAIFINSARGKIMDSSALLASLEKGTISRAVVDTWQHEPALQPDLVDRVHIATPHIAGYSYDGKVAGTVMVYRQLCRFLGVEPTWRPDDLLPPPAVPDVTINAEDRNDTDVLAAVTKAVYDIT
ncbi:MAG: 4-phosphoerythronate dehydrogenase, partial [Lentisphaerae bacterium]|nr:4-phosphoerythronate dehydrogenase [Lentisphaerota bacterium]